MSSNNFGKSNLPTQEENHSSSVTYLFHNWRPKNHKQGDSELFILLCVFILIMKVYFTLSTVVLRNHTQKNVCKNILSLSDLSFILGFRYL